jgi:GNAT superfamily N-acetyltransferase
MSSGRFSFEDRVTGDVLEEPPPGGFDCARESQNRFLYERAWPEQQDRHSTTYLYHVDGIMAAYASVCANSIVLGTREKPSSIRYKHIGVMKLAQLGVDHHFKGRGLGRFIVSDMIGLAREVSEYVACRYVALDAEPNLVDWYVAQGFRINRSEQRQRIEAAAGKRDAALVPVSMRFDLLDDSTL